MNGTIYGPDLALTPDQEDLLRTALSSNNPKNQSSPRISQGGASSAARPHSAPKQPQNTSDYMANGPNMFASPLQETPGSGQLGGFDESPFLDYELDDGVDWDNSGDQLFADLPGAESYGDGEHHDKRKASTDDEDEEEGTSKRREGDDKTAKKPGRKPMTGEPTTVCSFRVCGLNIGTDTLLSRNARRRIELHKELSVSAKNDT